MIDFVVPSLDATILAAAHLLWCLGNGVGVVGPGRPVKGVVAEAPRPARSSRLSLDPPVDRHTASHDLRQARTRWRNPLLGLRGRRVVRVGRSILRLSASAKRGIRIGSRANTGLTDRQLRPVAAGLGRRVRDGQGRTVGPPMITCTTSRSTTPDVCPQATEMRPTLSGGAHHYRHPALTAGSTAAPTGPVRHGPVRDVGGSNPRASPVTGPAPGPRHDLAKPAGPRCRRGSIAASRHDPGWGGYLDLTAPRFGASRRGTSHV